MPPPDLNSLLAGARDLTKRYMAGENPGSFQAFRDLVQLLLGNTILQTGAATRLARGPRKNVYAIGGYKGPTDSLSLTDGRFLRVAISLFITDTENGPRVKVESSK